MPDDEGNIHQHSPFQNTMSADERAVVNNTAKQDVPPYHGMDLEFLPNQACTTKHSDTTYDPITLPEDVCMQLGTHHESLEPSERI